MDVSQVCDYETAEQWLAGGRDPNRRKLANNTYAERREDGVIAVRLHNTDVVTYHADGSILLNSGGWLTMTTKARIETFTPRGIALYSRRGKSGISRWVVVLRMSEQVCPECGERAIAVQSYKAGICKGCAYVAPVSPRPDVVFEDGVLLVPDSNFTGEEDYVHFRSYRAITTLTPEDVSAADTADAAMNRRITKYAALYTDDRLQELVDNAMSHGTSGDCWYCAMQTDDGIPLGDKTGDTSHLVEHLDQGYVMLSLAVNAMRYAGYSTDQAQLFAQTRYLRYRIREAVRAYLRARLYSSTAATKHGRRPAVAPELAHRQNY